MGVMAAVPARLATETEREMSELPFAGTTPISVARVGLKARNAKALADYYSAIVGLEQLSSDGETITLGAKGRPLLVIEGDTAAKPDDPRSAGLFHTAFLLPTRADLGRWINFAAERQIKIDGASDHLVSEALYLDRSGRQRNRDLRRPHAHRVETELTVRLQWRPNAWTFRPCALRCRLVTKAGRARRRIPIVGHVHLRVGDPVAAEDWWQRTLGFDTVAKYGAQAVFLSTGGYHHHIGANTWQSAGAGKRDQGRSGLAWVELRSSNAGDKAVHHDPWGTEIRVVPGKPA